VFLQPGKYYFRILHHLASIKNYESTPPDFSILLHFFKKIKPDDISVLLLVKGEGRIYCCIHPQSIISVPV